MANIYGNIHQIAISTATLGDNTLVAAVAGLQYVVLAYVVVNGVATAQTIQWKRGATILSGAMPLPSSIGGSLIASSPERNIPILVTHVGDALILNLSAATQVSGHLTYMDVTTG